MKTIYKFDPHQQLPDREWESGIFSVAMMEIAENPDIKFPQLMALAIRFLRVRAMETPARITILTRYASRAVCNAMSHKRLIQDYKWSNDK